MLALDDLKLAFVLLHVDCDEFVANFGGMLRCVHYAEWVLFKCVKILGLCLTVTLPTLLPTNLIEALAKKDDEGENGSIECIIDFLAHCVEIQGEDLINHHAQLLLL